MIGERILVGLSYLDAKGDVAKQTQLYGQIESTDKNVITFIRSDGEGAFSIPFDSDSLHESNPESIYTLHTTGESVSGVNYVTTFNIHPGQEDGL